PDAERSALLAQLQALEMDALAVDDGVEGMKAALHAAATGRPFDIVLVAMQLDYLDGEELGRRLLERPATRNCCLAMMTQVGTRGDAKRLKEAGFSAYFLKPIPPEHLGELLRATLATMSLDDEQRRVQGLVTRYYVSDRKPYRFQVLVVEDDPVSREASCRRLEQLGCEVRSVGNGEECFGQIESSKPDLVLLDQNLPDLRGDEIAERLPRVVTGEPPPIVIFSAGLTQAEKQRCRQAGVAGFLTKPATTVGLRETLQRFGWKESEAPVDASADPGLLTAYLRESRKRQSEMAETLDAREIDRKLLYRIAHTLRSASSHVGASELASRFAGFEAEVMELGEASLREKASKLLADWREACDELDSERAEDQDQTVRLGSRRSRG
ncbi:MAG: response regulator, partial [Gammaproteobacteria bacterium]|nr:response regulator [Gammaproteobacteria bacterium]